MAGTHATTTPTADPVGGNGRRLLRLASERADTVSRSGLGAARPRGSTRPITALSPAIVDERVALVRAVSAERDVELHALVLRVVVTADPRRTAEQLREQHPDLSVDDILASPYLWIGTIDSICEGIVAAHERWGFSYFTGFHDSLQTIAPVEDRLTAVRVPPPSWMPNDA